MPEIYCLISNRDNKIRYVGKTIRDMGKRFDEHYWNRQRCSHPVYSWIRKERWIGFDISYETLCYCSYEEINFREAYWIRRLPALTNIRFHRPDRLYRLGHEEHKRIKEIERSIWSYVPNWQGYVGVRFYPDRNAWKVQIQTQWEFYFLRGDGGPIEMSQETYRGRFGHEYYTGDHYFSDGIDAVAARDEERIRADQHRCALGYFPHFWPPDVTVTESDPDDFDRHRSFTGMCPTLTDDAVSFLATDEPISVRP